MQKPNLDLMWETFIKIGLPRKTPLVRLYDTIQFDISSVISILRDNDVGNWYSFLIHDRNSGVPTNEDDNNLYIHIRFTLRDNVNHKEILSSLPKYCEMTRHIEPRPNSITGIDESLFKDENIDEAWRILGEQSEWFLQLLNAHKEDVTIPPQHIGQFLHYFANMAQLQVR